MSGETTIRYDENNLEFCLCQYLDGQLSRRERLDFERRLQQDESLRRELQRYAALEEYLTDLARDEVPGVDYDLQRAEILAAVEKKVLLSAGRRRPVFFRPVFGALAAAAMVVAAVTAGLLLRSGPARSGAPAISAVVLPAGPHPAGTGEVSVRMTAPDVEGLPLAPSSPARGLAPSGTVVVWISAADVPDAQPVEPMVFD